ncbi:helix-turn-helix transcriptional regulator [Bosea sp. OK403]|uniref:helix-turn-helix domain-containing protein n=1 Tax=Bosea sp. OK403 TaxID=1855286 RepID=UPI000B83AD8B|nr:helix-turn-helix transcriptional regulator [Bosea sp. OK403]
MPDEKPLDSLVFLGRKKGLSQVDLAAKLNISQGHLSKLINGLHEPGAKLRRRIDELAQELAGLDSSWLRAVQRAAQQSSDFRDAVSALLRIMHSNASADST